MSASTCTIDPGALVMAAMRRSIEKEGAGSVLRLKGSADDATREQFLLLRSAYIGLLEALIGDGMEPGDAIEGASIFGAFVRGALAHASCTGCAGCTAEAASELAENVFAGAGINASVETRPVPSAPAQPSAKH